MHILKIVASYACLYVVWSTTYYAIKLSVQGFVPWHVVGARFCLGGLGLGAAVLLLGRLRSLPSRREAGGAVLTGVFLLAGGNGFVTMAQTRVDSYLAALIIACTPIVVIFLDWLVLGKRAPVVALLGAACGIGGVAALMWDASVEAHVPTASLLFVLAGVGLWGLGTTLSKKVALPCDPLVSAAIQLTSVGAAVLAVSLAVSPPAVYASSPPSASSILGLTYLIVLGSIALVAYSFLLRHEPNYRITTYALVNPLFAVLIGLAVGHEKPLGNLLVGAVLILAGIALVLYGPLAIKSRLGSSSG